MGATGYRLRSWAGTRWRVALALVVVVALAGAMALTLLAGAARTLSAPERHEDELGFDFDVGIQQFHGAPRTDELDVLPATDEVAVASFVFGGLFSPGSDAPEDTLIFAGTHAALSTRLAEGREPDPAQPGEFLVTRRFVEANGARVGQEYELRTLTQAQADEFGFNVARPGGPSLRATVVGIVDGAADLNDDFPLAIFSPALLSEGDVGVAATVGVVSLADGFGLDDLRSQLDELPDGDAFSFRDARPFSGEVRAAVSAQGQGLLILALVVGVAAISVVGQLLSRQLRLGEAEADALRSLGGGSRLAVVEPAWRAVLVALPGAVGATALAYAFSGTFPIDFVRRVEPDPGPRFDPWILIGGAIAIVGLLVGWVRLALVADGRRSDGTAQIGFIERIAAVLPGSQLGTALRFAFGRPAARGGGANTSSLLGLTLVCAVVFGALTFGSNLLHLSDDRAQYGVNFDLALGVGEQEISEEAREALEASEDVSAVTLYGVTTVAIGTESLDVVGMDQVRGDLTADMVRGRLPRGADEIALGAVSARELDVGVGDVLTVAAPNGQRELLVTGIGVMPPIAGADGVGRSSLATLEGFLSIDGDATLNTAAVRVRGGPDREAARRIGEAVGSGIGGIDSPATVVNLERVRSIPFLVATAVGSLVVLSLAHLMLVSVRRRRLDHAVLRAIGATPRWLTGVVHWQATLTTLLTVAVAVPLGVAAGRALYSRLIADIGARADLVVPFAWIGATAAGLIVLANVVASIPGRHSRRVSPTRLLTRS